MSDQKRFAIEHHHAWVGQQLHATTRGIVASQQEVPIAVDEVHRRAAIRELANGFCCARPDFTRVVVTYPGFEQVPQDVQRRRATHFVSKEMLETGGIVQGVVFQMRVGNEKSGHEGIVGGIRSRHSRDAKIVPFRIAFRP